MPGPLAAKTLKPRGDSSRCALRRALRKTIRVSRLSPRRPRFVSRTATGCAGYCPPLTLRAARTLRGSLRSYSSSIPAGFPRRIGARRGSGGALEPRASRQGTARSCRRTRDVQLADPGRLRVRISVGAGAELARGRVESSRFRQCSSQVRRARWRRIAKGCYEIAQENCRVPGRKRIGLGESDGIVLSTAIRGRLPLIVRDRGGEWTAAVERFHRHSRSGGYRSRSRVFAGCPGRKRIRAAQTRTHLARLVVRAAHCLSHLRKPSSAGPRGAARFSRPSRRSIAAAHQGRQLLIGRTSIRERRSMSSAAADGRRSLNEGLSCNPMVLPSDPMGVV